MTMTWNVYPSMTKADMDKFLVAAFAVKENPYSVEELFDAAQDAVAREELVLHNVGDRLKFQDLLFERRVESRAHEQRATIVR